MSEKGIDLVKIRVLSIAGECQACHKVGDEVTVDNLRLSDYLCPQAMVSLWPFVQVLQYRGRFPWGSGDSTTIPCPDADNLVVFDVARVKE